MVDWKGRKMVKVVVAGMWRTMTLCFQTDWLVVGRKVMCAGEGVGAVLWKVGLCP